QMSGSGRMDCSQGLVRITLLAMLLATLAACAGAPGQVDVPTPVATPRALALPSVLAGMRLFVTDLATGDVAELGAHSYHVAESVHGLGLSNDQRTLYVSDIAGGQLLAFPLTAAGLGTPHRVKVGIQPVHMAQTRDGRAIYVTNFGAASVSVVDATSWRVMTTIAVPASPHGIALAPDGRYLYVACVNGGAIAIIDTTTQLLAGQIALPPGAHPYGVALSRDGRYLYVPDNFAGRLFTIDTATRQLIGETPIGQAAALIIRSSDGNTLYVTNGRSGTVSVLDLRADPAHPRPQATVRVGLFPHGLTLTPDGRYLVVANNLGDSLSVIATASDQVVATIAGERYPNDVIAVP
ncbi:MAG TPA: YncE family protein, partial [Ktedonobacterales bacterium]|nr:YncE family protein [Ktedonobacterales bacterium]